jgi:hypothetical protein
MPCHVEGVLPDPGGWRQRLIRQAGGRGRVRGPLTGWRIPALPSGDVQRDGDAGLKAAMCLPLESCGRVPVLTPRPVRSSPWLC